MIDALTEAPPLTALVRSNLSGGERFGDAAMIEGQEIRSRWFDRFLNPYRPIEHGFDKDSGNAWVVMAPHWWHPTTWALRIAARFRGAS